MSQPVYEGKTLSVWVNELQPDGVGPGRQPNASDEAVQALRAIGEKALPFLLEWLLQPRLLERPPDRIFDQARTLGPAAIPVATMESIRWRHEFPSPALIANALAVIGPQASSALPELVKALDDPQHPAWFWALDALAAFGTEATPVLLRLAAKFEPGSRQLSSIVATFGRLGAFALPALPFLMECVRNEDAGLRCSALNALGALRLRCDLVVPALISVLHDPEFLVRIAAVNAIGLYGKEGTSAVAELERLVTDPERFIREAVNRALDRIRP